MRIGIAGIGKMGQNHLKELESNPAFSIAAIFDLYKKDNFKYPLFNNIESFLDNKLDVAIIATPTSTHLEVAREVFKKVKVVLVEKPLAMNLEEMLEIKTLAMQYNTIVAVGLVERFNPVVLYLKKLLENEEIVSIDIKRFSPYPSRISDCGILQDLGVHDIDLLQFLSSKNIVESNIKKCFINDDVREDEAIISCKLEGGIIAGIHQSWNAYHKQRSLIVITKLAVYEADLANFTLFKNGESLQIPLNTPLYGEHKALLKLALENDFNNLADINTAIKLQQILESN